MKPKGKRGPVLPLRYGHPNASGGPIKASHIRTGYPNASGRLSYRLKLYEFTSKIFGKPTWTYVGPSLITVVSGILK